MSLIKSDVIRDAAEAAGVKQLREDVATSLAADAEYRLREIVQDALNFKRHSRRRKLTAADMCVPSSAISARIHAQNPRLDGTPTWTLRALIY
eukprot:3886741-Rhodomonas_salina.1